MPLVAEMAPVRQHTLGWWGWECELVGAEPQAPPEWAESPVDAASIEAQIRRETAHLTQDYQSAAHNVRYFAPVARAGLAACGFAVLSALFLALAYITTGFDVATLLPEESGQAADPEIPGLLGVAGFIALFGPWFAAVVIQRRRKLTRNAGFFLVGLGLWFLALVLACFTFGLSFVAMPLVVGVLALFTRPTVFQASHGTVGKTPANAFTMWRNAKRAATTARAAMNGLEMRIREEVARRQQEQAERFQAHQAALTAHMPYAVVGIPDVQDLIVVGGAPAERGDLLHHLGAAVAQRGAAIWVLDLEGRAVSARLTAEATYRRQPVCEVDTSDEVSITELLDGLSNAATRRSSALVDVLAYAMAQDADANVVARARVAADTLRRIEQHLRGLPGGMTLTRLHAALDALLAGRDAVPGGVAGDDFGLAGPETLAAVPTGTLPAEVVQRIRSSFSQQDRSHFYPVWTDLRIKLEALLPEPAQARASGLGAEPRAGWSPAGVCNVVTVPATLSRADRDLHAHLVVAHHLQLLKTNGPVPAALAVVGAGQIPRQLLAELSEAAAGKGVLLMLMFTELTPAIEEMALGRRDIAVFGGHGAQAAERLADLFGKDWTARVQSYQDSLSEAEAESRSTSSGRNWSKSSQQSRTRGSSTSHSTSYGGGPDSYNTHSYGRGSQRSDTSTEGESWGGSTTNSETTGRTRTEGHAKTTTVEYERQITGAAISALVPFTMLLKVGNAVRYVDVKADLPLPVPPTPGSVNAQPEFSNSVPYS